MNKIYKEYQSVDDLNIEIKNTIEPLYHNIKVHGEISNLKISNNNLFATLKDNNAMINIVSFGYGYKKNIIISNGDNVSISGKLTYYPKSGNICFLVYTFEKLHTTGNLYQEYEQLKQKYDQLGYFSNKKSFPNQLNQIGILTSVEGAALQDIIYVLKNNGFNGKIIIKNCIVQGNQSVKSIVDGINILSQYNHNNNKLDLILITRGGGGFEDLISFSSSEIIEAIHNCNIFTISAIGHEIDFMLSDFVADLRAPTPSVAGEIIASFKKNKLLEYKKQKSFIETQMNEIIISNIKTYKDKISLLIKSNDDILKKLSNEEIKLESIQTHITNTLKTNIISFKNNLEKISSSLQKYDIQNMLQQGYVVLLKNNRIIDSIEDIKYGQKLKIKLKDGEINVIVDTNKHDNQ